MHQYLERCHGNDYASWSRYCLALLKQPIVPRALLIGIGKHAPGEYERWKLDGPANDVALIWRVLTTDYGFAESNVSVLLDEQATWQAIERALQDLAAHAQSNDPVVIYLSGVGFFATKKTDGSGAADATPERSLLMTYDGPTATVSQLHERLLAIPSSSKALIIDGMPVNLAIDLAEQAGDYALLLAAEPGQTAREQRLGDETDETFRPHGLFTFSPGTAARGWRRVLQPLEH
ncbi:MAG: caspase family protein [Anaerolineae bacterium]|nr:caspase family protein [Anaerolineae bacterium]